MTDSRRRVQRPVRRGRRRKLAALALAAAATLPLAACSIFSGETPAPTATAPASSVPPTLEPGEEIVPTAAPELHPGGTAVQNKQYFDAMIGAYHSAYGMGGSQLLVDHLASAGFDKGAMEVTWDSTPIGYDVDSIEVGVRIGSECLIGQVRGDGWMTSIQPLLSTGRCLIGDTMPFA